MREVTKLLINDFKIKELNMDFMGYSLQKGEILTFHHLLVPNRHGGPYAYWNGVILRETPHQYLHVIENFDYCAFGFLTSEMQDMKVKGFLDMQNIENINEILLDFEYKYQNKRSKKGKLLIKPEYKRRVLTKM